MRTWARDNLKSRLLNRSQAAILVPRATLTTRVTKGLGTRMPSISIFFFLRRFFSSKPHVAGSDRQKELAEELAKRWKEYGFDHVEMPEYKALLSFPDTKDPTRITIKYKNGTIIHQVKGEEQV